ncbi:formate-nitrite transporter family [Chloropicon primus]|nr:formate-nitrite transporter family [Chloropicon primus]|mmetsp:Transcript_31933/g.69013  ORF Transcript_31933/g.69013 Transcript_31933/m.69013 type:complete len:328 (-) Transcript_31933:1165-2148(-)
MVLASAAVSKTGVRGGARTGTARPSQARRPPSRFRPRCRPAAGERRAGRTDAPRRGNVAARSAASPPSALAPPAVYKAACSTAEAKAKYSWDKTLVLGFLAGSLIGIGALLCSVVSGSSPGLASSDPGLASFLKGAIGLPAGLSMVVLTGAELFTGNVFVMISGLLAGRVKAMDLLKNWFWSFNGNFAGSVFVAFLSFLACTTSSEALTAAVTKAAVAKVSMSFGVLFAKGVLCNWLVCLAVWMAMASNTVPGKLLGIFIPISTFVTLGAEHSIANQFLISQGILAGADISIKQFLVGNMLPVTLGNIVGSAVFVALAHWYAYDLRA